MSPTYQHFRIDESLPDRFTIWIDVRDRSVNVLNEPVLDELNQIVEAASHWATLPLVLRSAKQQGFVFGADLRRILDVKSDSEIQEFLLHGQTVFDHWDSRA
jgi:3-hydroxyacyl-CoA dehydrogenase/enoyl-CoA hydratase/3-hydroxybutyryl-CoA epimerase